MRVKYSFSKTKGITSILVMLLMSSATSNVLKNELYEDTTLSQEILGEGAGQTDCRKLLSCGKQLSALKKKGKECEKDSKKIPFDLAIRKPKVDCINKGINTIDAEIKNLKSKNEVLDD